MIKRVLSIIISVTITISIVSLCAVVHATSSPSSWAVNEVNAAVSEGLVTDSVSRDYQVAITREQFCEMVVLAYEKISGNTAKTGSDSFYDTDNNEVLKAANLGIVTGYGDGIFGPKDLITREQIAAMLVRMIDVAVPYANINVYNNNHFADNSAISDWARPAVNFAYDNKLMQGVGDNKIDPLANTTCEQAVLLVYRAFDNYYNEEAQLDSIYELTEEHIAQDDETYVYYTDNIILAFIKRGLTEDEKEDIADIIDGDVVAQLAGSINLLQIEVEASNLDELIAMTDAIEESDKVYYATIDYLSHTPQNGSYEPIGDEYAGEDSWWFKAIEADYVLNNYSYIINPLTIGVIDSVIDDEHIDLAGKVSFVDDYYEQYNEINLANELHKHLIDGENDSYVNHGTMISGIIAANRNSDAITGVFPCSNILFASFKPNEMQWESISGTLYAFKKMRNADIKVINMSLQDIWYDGNYVNEHKTEEPFNKYSTPTDYYTAQSINRRESARAVTAAMCDMIKQNEQFLAVQCAGNGVNNSGPGIDAHFAGDFATINTSNEDIIDILRSYGIMYSDLTDHIIIVGAVQEELDAMGNYQITYFSNYGNGVDICAPGENILSCSVTSVTGADTGTGTSEAAPMVTGTAGLLWGIEPTLTAAEVKDYIINGAKYKAIGVTGSDAGKEYPMLNVRGAVEQLIEKRNVNIMVIDSAGEGALSDVTINYGDNLTAKTDIIGSCDIYLPKGYSEIALSKDGYKSQTVTIEDQYIGQTGDWVDGKIIELEKEEIQNTFNGHIYQFINKKRKWEDAKKYCEEQGGYLVTITSPEENEFVSRLSTNGESFWIGATTDNNFTWATGEQALFTETLEYGEPSAAAKYIVSSSNGYWTNLTDREMCFICEWGDIYEQNQEFEVVDQIQGWWFCYNDEELMEHFSINICFNDDGAYESTSWREKRTGTYTISGNTITVNYDYYYNYAGSTDYNYEWSGVEIFEFDGNTLRRISDTYNGDTNDNIIIFEHKDGYTDPYSV